MNEQEGRIQGEQSGGRQGERQQDEHAPPPALGAAAGTDHAPSGQPPQRNVGNDEQRQKCLWRRRDLVELALAIAVALFTGAQVGVSYWQWQSMQGQLAQMQLDRRAWLNFGAKLVQTPDAKLQIEFELRNSGGTPGWSKKVRVSAWTNGGGPDLDQAVALHKVAPEVSHVQVVPPNATEVTNITAPLNVQPAADVMDELEKGSRSLIVFATLEYTDAQKTEGETQACWIYDPASKSLISYGQLNAMK